MSKRIGIVSEGPTDYLVLKSIIDKISGEDNQYLSLQPEQDMAGRYGNGWKGVWKWCKEIPPLNILMDSINPQIDLVVIQMDGDVVRKEKEVHCWCEATVCETQRRNKFPLYCKTASEGECPIELPCNNHNNGVSDYINHGKSILDRVIGGHDKNKVVITIPCDSTDAWIVAAYESLENIEKIKDPWRSIISKGKYYHDVRVRGEKKNVTTYAIFANHLSENWGDVLKKCLSARRLDEEIRKVFGKNR